MLKADQLNEDIKKALAVVFCTNKADKADEIDEVDKVDEVNEVDDVDEVEVKKNEDIVDVRDYINQNLHQHSNLQRNLETSSSSTEMAGSRIENQLKDLLDKAYQNNKIVNSIITAKQAGLQKLPADLAKQGIKLAMRDLTLEGDNHVGGTKLYVKGKMYVPNEEKLRLLLLQQHHNPAIQGHLGHKAML